MAYEFAAANTQTLSAASSPLGGNVYPYTLACWFYQTTLATGLLLTMNPAAGNYAGIAILTGGNVRALFSAEGGQTDTSTTATANTWNHACGVFSSANSRTAYLNAGGATTNTANVSASNFTEVLIGARRLSGTVGTFYTGLIAECGIWNVALTAAEIASLADGMTCDKVRPQSLVFYAPLVRDLQDVRGGLTITNNNSATVANHPRVYA
jgi:hypothetical protein